MHVKPSVLLSQRCYFFGYQLYQGWCNMLTEQVTSSSERKQIICAMCGLKSTPCSGDLNICEDCSHDAWMEDGE